MRKKILREKINQEKKQDISKEQDSEEDVLHISEDQQNLKLQFG